MSSEPAYSILVCLGPNCNRDGESQRLLEEVKSEFGDRYQEENLSVGATTCLGHCGLGPNVLVLPESRVYEKMDKRVVLTLVMKTFALLRSR